jgi:uncharacterized cupredoxin-like copper-binding protein
MHIDNDFPPDRLRRRSLSLALLAVVALAAPKVWAHGDAAHAKAGPAGPKEQKDWGIAGDARDVRRTIDIGMTDTMRFTPDKVTVRLGETVRFRIRNRGHLLHEMVIGTRQELEDHAALMLKFPNMEHAEPYMAHVAKGRTGQIVWTFNRAGEFEFACLVAGHFQAGMVGKITVQPG